MPAAMASSLETAREASRQHRVSNHWLVQHGPGTSVLSGSADSSAAVLQEYGADDRQITAQHDDADDSVAVPQEGRAPRVATEGDLRGQSGLLLMFTLEESALLRLLLRFSAGIVVCLVVLATAFMFRSVLVEEAVIGLHAVESGIHSLTHGHWP